jgi:hypothetical protein
MVAAGVFRADPMDGFPVGTPAGPGETSWHGGLHYLFAGVAFAALIAACFALGRRFKALGQRGWALYSRVTGAVFMVSWLGVASGQSNRALNVALDVGVVLAWSWVTAVSAHLLRRVDA